MRGLISLVDDNHVHNNLKEILVYVYHGSTVNNRQKKKKMVLLLHVNRESLEHRSLKLKYLQDFREKKIEGRTLRSS